MTKTAVAEKISKDPIFASQPRAKTAIESFIAKCDEAIKAAAEGDKPADAPESGDGK